MKRHLSLEPFSRDHNDGLILARRISEAPGDADPEPLRQKFVDAWRVELEDHFAEEERLLSHLSAPDMAERLRREHRQIEARVAEMAAPVSLEHVKETGQMLYDHIRWEERELFPHIEGRSTDEQLLEVLAGTDAVELRRHAIDPKREELVLRRWQDRPDRS